LRFNDTPFVIGCNESCEWYHTYKWVMSHTWILHVTHMRESSHIYTTQLCQSRAYHIYIYIYIYIFYQRHSSWRRHVIIQNFFFFDVWCILTQSCDVTQLFVSQDSFICVTWLIHMCHNVSRDSFLRVTGWHIQMCHVHDLFTCVKWLIYMCHMTHSYVSHDSFTCVTWLIHMCHNVSHDSFLRVTGHILMCHVHDLFKCVTWPIHMCHMTHSCVSHELRDKTHAYLRGHVRTRHLHAHVGHDSFICMWHDSCVPQRIHAYARPSCPCVTWLIHMCVTWLMRTSEDTRFRDTFIFMSAVYVECQVLIEWCLIEWNGVATISRMLKNICLFAEYRSLF